jgi:poly-gamma-glutamate capsule biosynthesis protein CapA/YwtB (metallophosphatase superfamily)
MYKILITGDLVVNRPYDVSEQISNEMLELFSHSNLNISNLEAPITNSDSKILKTGPHLKSDKIALENVLKSLAIDVVTLANNHILDYDEQGVYDTLHFCENLNIKTVGAGRDLKDAGKTLFIDTDEGRLAIVNFAENEWASATDSTAGSNPVDLIDNSRQIQNARHEAQFVMVIVHGGHEYYNLPSPRMQKQYRFYADQGADIVIGHHTHCINGHEIYKGVPIYYSLGNFLFTKNSKKDDWYTGLLLSVVIRDGKLKSFLYPIGQKRGSFDLSLLKGTQKELVERRIAEYNAIINCEYRLVNEWEKYVDMKSREYLNSWSPFSYIDYNYLPAIFNKLRLTFSNRRGASLFLNLMRCEAHYDISKEILTKYLKK